MRHRRWQPPQATPVSRGNPITRGLQFLYVPQNHTRDLISTEIGTQVAGVQTPFGGSPYGFSGEWSASSLAFAAATGVFAPPQVSCFALVMPAGPQPTNAGIIVKEYAGSGGGTPSYGLVANYSGSGIVAWSIRQAGSQKGPTPTVALANYTKYAIAGTYDGAYAKLFVNGIQKGASKAVTGSPQYASGSGSSLLVGGVGDSAVTGPWNGAIYLAAMWNRGLSITEVRSLTANPWQLFEPQWYRRTYSIASSAITGSGASTDVDTSAASGTESIAGAGASSDIDAASATGSESISGTGASSDTDQASAVGSESIAGSGASADSDAATATGAEAITGTGASADTDTSAAIGTLSDAGTGASADVDASAATGSETITGSGASTDVDQSVASGSAGSGGVGASVDVDTSSATGGITESGSGASADVDASSASGGEAITGSGASADKDTSTATGSVIASITGSGASQDVDTSTALAGETIAGVGASTDVDVSSATGSQNSALVIDPRFIVNAHGRLYAVYSKGRSFSVPSKGR